MPGLPRIVILSYHMTNHATYVLCTHTFYCVLFIYNFVLQSLLCSSYTSAALAERVLSMIETYTQIPGRDSLHVLCLITVNIQRAVAMVLYGFPSKQSLSYQAKHEHRSS